MRARSLSPIQVTTFRWQPSAGAYARTLVCKATFDLVPGKVPLSAVQDPILLSDEHYDDDAEASVYRPSDLIPFKTRADVLLVGEAFAPGGEPVRSVVAELMVRETHKAVEVFRDRYFNHGGDLVEGKRFVNMGLRWERARGGELTTNPVGIDPEGERDRYGRLSLPNLQPPGLNITQLSDRIEPVGFGPLATLWPWRASLLGRHADSWPQGWTQRPLPTDIDSSYFNCAPRDQRIDELSEGERIALNHLHPTEERLVCHLPAIRPIAFVERNGAARQVELRADTLWIDSSRSVLTVTWRGRIDLSHAEEDGLVLVGVEEAGHPLSWAHLNALARGERPPDVQAPPPAPQQQTVPQHVPAPPPIERPSPAAHTLTPLPAAAMAALNHRSPDTQAQQPAFMNIEPMPPTELPDTPRATDMAGRLRSDTVSINEDDMRSALAGRNTALPFQGHGGAPPPVMANGEMVAATRRGDAVGAATNEFDDVEGTLVSAEDHAPPWLRNMLRDRRAKMQAGDGAANGDVAQTLVQEEFDESDALPGPWQRPPAVEAPPPSNPMNAARPVPPQRALLPTQLSESNPGAAEPQPVPPHVPRPSMVEATKPAPRAEPPSRGIGVLGSNLELRETQPEMDVTPIVESSLPSARGIVELLWMSPAAAALARQHDAWKSLAGSEPQSQAEADVQQADRQLLISVLHHGSTTNTEDLRQQMLQAAQSMGGYKAPLALLGGEMRFAFDAAATLKATVTALAPHAIGDDKLAPVLKSVNELMSADWMQDADDAAHNLTAKLRAAASNVNTTELDVEVRRSLLRRRAYRKQSLFGEDHIVAQLRPSGLSERIPCYLPARLAETMPMFEQLKANLLAEAHLRQDQYESHDIALRIMALGRTIDFSAGR